jgi:two-component system, OmpR family, phosphate regulon sensor histidine kinase PhoR
MCEPVAAADAGPRTRVRGPAALGDTGGMSRLRFGMRWWLAAVFVGIAALAALLVATVSSRQADESVRSNSQEIAVGKSVAAGFAVEAAIDAGDLSRTVVSIGRSRGIAVFVFSPAGNPLTPTRADGIRWSSVPNGAAALATALADHRFVHTVQGTGATVVGLPLRRTAVARAIVVFAARPAPYATSLAIFHHEVIRAALWSVLIAAAAGLLAATLIARRLRRIATAARAIEQGDFDTELRPGFRDEVGSLAMTINGMRGRLRDSFELLRRERDRLDVLFEQLQEAVVAVDRRLEVQFANSSARELLGEALASPGAPLPESWAEISLRDLARRLFRDDATVAEARAGVDDGARTVSLVGLPARGSDLVVLVFTDITARELRERAEREFVANASHELRTPVSAIMSAVEALQSGAADRPDDRDAFIALIARQATRLGRLTRSLLILARAESRQEPVKLELVRLRPLLDEVAASLVAHPDVSVEIECAGDLAAFAHADLAEQVISNLAGNALKYTTSGHVVLSAREAGENVLVEVVDTGPGIPLDTRRRIFDRFSSGQNGRRDGFGLGLAIVSDAVRALGGSFDVASEPGRGTTARVTLAGRGKR